MAPSPVLTIWLNCITPLYQAAAFVSWRAMALVAMTTIMAYIPGRALGAIQNQVYER
jgi:hypothetical protein